jgi:hypothetical protein
MTVRQILIGGAAGTALALLLIPSTGGALHELNAARVARGNLAALAASPPGASSPLAPSLALAARDSDAARRALAARVERLARSGGVLVESVEGVSAPSPIAMVRVRLSGGDKAVIALADAITRERPLMRFQTWRIVPAEGGGIRLTGEIVAVRR